MHTIIKYLKLTGTFAKISMMSLLEYRINFAAGMLVELGWMLIKLMYVVIIYRAGTNIGILTPDHILLFVGTYVLMTGIYMLYYNNFTSLPGMVQQGELDLYIVKPVSLQFLISVKRLDFAFLVPDMAAGTVMIIMGWQRAALPVSIGSIIGFLFFFLCGCLLTYSLFLLPYLISFWTVSVGGLGDMTAALWDFNNMPQLIYNKWVQRVGTFILPIFVVTNFPGLFLMGELSGGSMVWGILAPVIFFLIGRIIWHRALKRYSSASS